MIVFVAILPLLGSVESDSNHGKENEVVHQQYDYKRPDFDLSQLKVIWLHTYVVKVFLLHVYTWSKKTWCRQHCHINICRYIGSANKYWDALQNLSYDDVEFSKDHNRRGVLSGDFFGVD